MELQLSISPLLASRALQKWFIRLLTVIIALTINLILFSLMPYLLHSSNTKPLMGEVIPQINVIRLKKPESPIKRTLDKPPEPPAEKKPRKPPSAKPALPKLSLPFSINPRLPQGPDTLSMPILPAVKINTTDLYDIFQLGELDSPLIALVRIPPVYPPHAKNRAIEGWVLVRFIVNEDGHVENITVQESEPVDVFDASVIRCVSSWRFKVGTVDGIAVKSWVETTVRFTLD